MPGPTNPRIKFFIDESCYQYNPQQTQDDCTVEAKILSSREINYDKKNDKAENLYTLDINRVAGKFQIQKASDPKITLSNETKNYLISKLEYGLFIRRVITTELLGNREQSLKGNLKIKDLPVDSKTELSLNSLNTTVNNLIFLLSFSEPVAEGLPVDYNNLNFAAINAVVYLRQKAPDLLDKLFNDVLPKLNQKKANIKGVVPFLGWIDAPEEFSQNVIQLRKFDALQMTLKGSLPAKYDALKKEDNPGQHERIVLNTILDYIFAPAGKFDDTLNKIAEVMYHGESPFAQDDTHITNHEGGIYKIKAALEVFLANHKDSLPGDSLSRTQQLIRVFDAVLAFGSIDEIIGKLDLLDENGDSYSMRLAWYILVFIKRGEYTADHVKFAAFAPLVEAYAKKDKNVVEIYDIFFEALNKLNDMDWLKDDPEGQARYHEVVKMFETAFEYSQIKNPQDQFFLSMRQKYNGDQFRRNILDHIWKCMPIDFSGEEISLSKIDFISFYKTVKYEYIAVVEAIQAGGMDQSKQLKYMEAINFLMITLFERGGKIEYYWKGKFVQTPNFYDQIPDVERFQYDDMKAWIKDELAKLNAIPGQTPHFNLGQGGLIGDAALLTSGGIGLFSSSDAQVKTFALSAVFAGLGGAALNLGVYALDIQNEYYWADIVGAVLFGAIGFGLGTLLFEDETGGVPIPGANQDQFNTVTDYGYLKFRF